MVSQERKTTKETNNYGIILQVAEDLFARKGYDGVSIQEIAEKAGISKSLILYHFKDKKTLYKTIIKKIVGLVFYNLQELLQSSDSPEEKITNFIKRYFELLFKEENLIHILFREWTNPESPTAKYIIQKSAKIVGLLSEIINEGIKSKDFKNVNARITAISLFGMLNTYVTAKTFFYKEFSKEEIGGFTIENLTKENAKIFLEGLKKC